jgi:hypothetical protein
MDHNPYCEVGILNIVCKSLKLWRLGFTSELLYLVEFSGIFGIIWSCATLFKSGLALPLRNERELFFEFENGVMINDYIFMHVACSTLNWIVYFDWRHPLKNWLVLYIFILQRKLFTVFTCNLWLLHFSPHLPFLAWLVPFLPAILSWNTIKHCNLIMEFLFFLVTIKKNNTNK